MLEAMSWRPTAGRSNRAFRKAGSTTKASSRCAAPSATLEPPPRIPLALGAVPVSGGVLPLLQLHSPGRSPRRGKPAGESGGTPWFGLGGARRIRSLLSRAREVPAYPTIKPAFDVGGRSSRLAGNPQEGRDRQDVVRAARRVRRRCALRCVQSTTRAEYPVLGLCVAPPKPTPPDPAADGMPQNAPARLRASAASRPCSAPPRRGNGCGNGSLRVG